MLRKSLLGLSFLILSTSLSLAAGAPYWNTNGVTLSAVSGTGNASFVYGMVGDGAGNYIVAWSKGLSADRNVYAQKVSAGGIPQWSAPVPICEAPDLQKYVQIVADGSGGAVIAWMDKRDGVREDVYAQRVDSGGSILWGTDGKMVGRRQLGTMTMGRLKMVGDGKGGAILAWETQISGMMGVSWDIYGQKINSSGDYQWPSSSPTIEGINIFGWIKDQQNPALVGYFPEGSDDIGALIACEESEKGSTRIKIQKVNPAGNPLWGGGSGFFINFSTGNLFQRNPVVLHDGSGGVFAVCEQSKGMPPPYGTGSLLAQRLDNYGSWEVWGANGVRVYQAASATGMLLNPQIASDGAGGIVVMWSDGRNYAAPDENQFDIYVQRLDGSGARLYSTPQPICTAAGLQLLAVGSVFTFDNLNTSGGYGIATWNDFRRAPDIKYNDTNFDSPSTSIVTWESDIYAQKFQISDGSVAWLSNGIPLTTASNMQLAPSIVSDGSGGGVVAFSDSRYADINNIWAMAQRVTDIDPTITSVTTASSYVIGGTSGALNNFGCDPRTTVGDAAYGGNNYVTLDGSRVEVSNVVSWSPKTIVVRGNEGVGPHTAAVTAYGITAAKSIIIPGPGPVFSEEYLNDKKYIKWDIIPVQFTLKAKVESPLGLDISGIYLRIDNRDPVITIPLSSYSVNTKILTYTHPDSLLEGTHTLDLYAKDIYDNYGPMDSLSVKVGGEPVLNPIPVFDGTRPTTISFVLPAASQVMLRIYSLDGPVAWESGPINATWGYNEYLFNGKNSAGQLMGNGIYPITMSVNGVLKRRGHLVISYK